MVRTHDSRLAYAGKCPCCGDIIKQPFTRGNRLPFAYLHPRRPYDPQQRIARGRKGIAPPHCRLVITVPDVGPPIIEIVGPESIEEAVLARLDKRIAP